MAKGKHFIENVDDIVLRGLRSLLWSDPSLRLIAEKKVIYRQPLQDERKVILISGGGSGHEPAHAGFVGAGMLDVAVGGDIFASPSASQILAGIEALDTTLGALLIVKNYTGDKLNFGLAAAKAKARGRDVRMVVVEDDVSIKGNSLVGRRGLAGVALVHKVAGAAAAQGLSLESVTRIAQNTADSVATVAASLDRCSVPNRKTGDTGGLAPDEMEYGMGIHNEPGVERTKFLTMQKTIERLIDMLFDNGRGLQFEDGPVAVLVNNLGGLSVLETQVLADEVVSQVRTRIKRVARVYVGTFVTSLDGPGISITTLKLDEEMLDFLDAPAAVNNWPRTNTQEADMNLEQRLVSPRQEYASEKDKASRIPMSTRLLSKVIECIAESVGEAEPRITKYDTLAGDGDCGTTLLNGVNALVRYSTSLVGDEVDLAVVLRQIAGIIEETMGGTSGAIYAIYLNAVSSALEEVTVTKDMQIMIAGALQQGLKELCKYTSARVGGRTMMDALIPFVETLASANNLKTAVDAAVQGADKTRKMDALLGRASYVAKEQFSLEEGGLPDPGALGIVALLSGIVAGLSSS